MRLPLRDNYWPDACVQFNVMIPIQPMTIRIFVDAML